MTPPSATLAESTVGLAWLLRLRWVAVGAQALVLSVATLFLGANFSLPAIAALIGFAALSNVGLHLWTKQRRPAPNVIGSVLVLDTLLLTAMLLLSGGPTNPFSVFYIVHVALAALLLDNRWTWGLSVLTSLAFGSLFLLTSEASMHAMHHGSGFTTHLRGMWLSYTLAAFVVGYFVARVARALAAREREIADLRDLAARNERLASLTTLAAGAAHELGSPLATIAVVAGELKRASSLVLDPKSVAEDAELLRAEAERCRLILQKMAGEAGSDVGEAPREVTTNEIVHEATTHLSPERKERLEIARSEGTLRVPPRALGQMIANLLSNAFDSYNGDKGRVSLKVQVEDDLFLCVVCDQGAGMPPEIVRRLGEPFFTTKGPSRGLGLGFFLVRTFADRFRGSLDVQSKEGSGTQISLKLPARFT